MIRVKEFQSATFEHGSNSPAQAYREDAHPRDVTAVLFTTQLCFFPPSKDVIPFCSVQLIYTDGPPGSNSVKVQIRIFAVACNCYTPSFVDSFLRLFIGCKLSRVEVPVLKRQQGIKHMPLGRPCTSASLS